MDKFILNRGFRDVNPILCGQERCKPGHACGYAVRQLFLIHCVVQGKGTFVRKGEEPRTLGPGDLFLIRPGESTLYQADRDTPWTYIWIGFDGPGCRDHLETTLFAENQSCVCAPYAVRLFEEALAIDDRAPATELLMCAKILELFAALQRTAPSAESAPKEHVRHAMDYIRANYMRPITVGGIAKMLSIDRRYFSRIFTEHSGGVTPSAFLQRVRLTRAAEMLRRGDCSVAEAARNAGYDDAFHFSNLFKKKYGLSPSAYRKAALRGQIGREAGRDGSGS